MSNSKGPKNRGFSKRFRNKLATPNYISVYECVNISTFALLDVKLWLEEDRNVNTHHLYIHSDLFSLGLKIDK